MNGELVPFSEELRAEVVSAESYSFAVPPDLVGPWIERAGPDQVRAWRAGGRVAGAVVYIPMGVFFGGRSIKNLGIAGVAIQPEHRGRGHGYAMMAAALREARRSGFAVSTLYPATVALYRKCGYELGGGHYSITLPLSALSAIRSSEGEIVPVSLDQLETLRGLQRPIASTNDGNIDRGPYVWKRVFSPRNLPMRGFGVAFGGTLEGYVLLRVTTDRDPPYQDLSLTDLVATTPRAIRRLLSFLADHRSLAREVSWFGDPHDRFVSTMPEKAHDIRLYEHWMLRIVDVAAALEARGYRYERAAAFELEVEDPEIAENRGRIRVEFEDGRARVVAALGGPAIHTSVRALAAMYTGYQPATVLAAMGWLEGDQAALDTADRVFAGRTPWTSEMY